MRSIRNHPFVWRHELSRCGVKRPTLGAKPVIRIEARSQCDHLDSHLLTEIAVTLCDVGRIVKERIVREHQHCEHGIRRLRFVALLRLFFHGGPAFADPNFHRSFVQFALARYFPLEEPA